MGYLYALFVGIDDYPERPLKGCVNDVRAGTEWLRSAGFHDEPMILKNEEATSRAVLSGIDDHLSRGGPGDTVLFWFSGHGSSERTGDPREATGYEQALVCVDSTREERPAILDKELAARLDRIAERGAHVVAILDCCFSGGMTRDEPGVRSVEWRPWWSAEEPRTRGAGHLGPETHRFTLLAGCRLNESAYEAAFREGTHGRFTHALLRTLKLNGPNVTYRELRSLAEARILESRHDQHPTLHGPGDRRFLLGERLLAAPFLLRHTSAGWQVDCGRAHGLRAAGAEFGLLPTPGRPSETRTVSVQEVRPESSIVTPAGWRPDSGDYDRAHPVTPTALAFPRVPVTITGEPAATRRLAQALDGSAYVRSAAGPLADGLRVDIRDGLAGISGGAGHPLPAMPVNGLADARTVAGALDHMAWWHHLRDLDNPDRSLSSLVDVQVEGIGCEVGRTATGEFVCSYGRDGVPPTARVRLVNGSDSTLWCTLLDLTDSYGSGNGLYEGDFIGPQCSADAHGGEPVWFFLPESRPIRPGAHVTDWLKLIVAEQELNTEPFRLPPLSVLTPADRAGGGTLPVNGLLRINGPETRRDTGRAGPAGGPRWGAATVVVVRTVVPG